MEEVEAQHNIFTSVAADAGVMHVSKWQEFHLSLDVQSAQKLFEKLGLSFGYRVGQIVAGDEWKYSVTTFLKAYETFLMADPSEFALFRRKLSLGLSSDPSAFSTKEAGAGFLLVPRIPYIQVRASTYTISNENKVLPGALGADVQRWGLHFSYPLLCMHSNEGIAKNVLLEARYFNTDLFKQLRQWVRDHTKPATLSLGSTQIKTTMRCMR